MTVVAWVVALVALVVAVAAVIVARRAAAPIAPPQVTDEGEQVLHDEARLSAVFAALPVASLRVDSDAVINAVNPAALATFPFLDDGLGVLEAFGDHQLSARVRDAIRTGDPARFDLRLFVEGRRTFRVVLVPFDVEGVREVLITLTDSSEATAYQELRSQFVANVSHELRTPLTGLRGMLEALEDPEMPPEMRADFVVRSRAEAEHLEALIDDVLFLSELESQQGDPAGERSDVSEVVPGVVSLLEGEAGEQGVGLVADVEAGLWTPLTPRMAQMVVRNLAENAVRYAGPGATAVVRGRRVGDCVEIEVADDGLGIPERDLPHVFERFYRADPSRSRRLGGTGLGLSIVKHIADRTGGEAEITSREGFGTTVRVIVPAVAAPVTDVPGGAGAGSGDRERW
jgi:two-component system phosphate regulon sensor histidine kinase PhoR